MQQITVVSGKGGTGKTSITSAFAALSKNAVFADCDVDAANLYLTLTPENHHEEVFPGSKTAVIDEERCTQCGLCEAYCRFEAITLSPDGFKISEFSCEGCELCMQVCPHQAIHMEQSMDSRWFVGETRFGPMVHAKLGVAEDLSGKLVTLVRDKAKSIAEEKRRETVLIDGPPGIGCPVIASITGTDKVVVVTEPSKSGLHDLERVIGLAESFRLKVAVIINKFDINSAMAKQLERYCQKQNIPILGKVPFNTVMVDAMVQQKSVVEYAPQSNVSREIKNIWSKINHL